MAEQMHYFRPVEGRAARRYGTDAFIGATRSPKGFVINTEVVVAISDTEIAPNRKAYSNYLRHGDLQKATKAEYDEYQAARKKKSEQVAKERKAKRDKEAKAAKDAAKKAEAAAKAAAEAEAAVNANDNPDDSASEGASGGSAA